MKFTKVIILTCVLCLGFSFAGNTQTLKSFTPDSVTFLEEMTGFFEGADKKRGKKFMEEFTLVWYGGKLTEKQRDGVYRMSNAMLKKRMRPYPQFEKYLFSIMSFVQSGQSDESFNTWQETLEKLVDGRKKKDFENYIIISSDLFADNILYKSASVTWQSSNSDYQFVYDSLPKIVFPNLNLRCFAKRDSSVIYNTRGVYYPTKGYFEGDGGKVTWERVGLDENETFCVFGDFEIKVRSASYQIDSVIFSNAFFQEPLKGRLSEKVLAKTGEDATYPRFESYDVRLKIQNIVDGVDYDGGFTVHGAKLLGSGTDENPARLMFYRNDETFLVASSKNFSIKPDRILAPQARVVFYLEEDSIIHPGLSLKFIREERMLTLVRDEEGVSKSPYYNTYHNVDMEFEALYWKIDDPVIQMGALFGSTNLKARFQSANYYNEGVWQLLQGMDPVHPLIRLKDVSMKLDSREFHAQELANDMRITLPQIIPMLINLSNMGFITYDIESKYISVNDKTFDYRLARAGKKDYDGIEFKSEVKGKSNASLNLLNFDLTINGVRVVTLSDSQQVKAVPADQTVIMTRDRNFSYGGILAAGRTFYYGKEFSFEYDEFKVNLINVDSMRLNVLSINKMPDGRRPVRRVRTVIEGVKGVINIDNPFNKSGIQEDYTEYPILHCTKKSYCFYDGEGIQKGVYNRDKFYFQLQPFTMDSLDNFTNEDLKFDGTFVSAGIFPDFEEQLTLQNDYSLGFIRNTPTDGFGMYGDKGEFNNEIRLSHAGLKGDGKVEFLTSTSVSNDFTFFPDSTSGVAKFVNVEKKGSKVEFPEVDGEDVRIVYLPHREALIAKKLENKIKFFGDQAELDGSLVLRPKGMIGRGVMTFEEAVLTSKRFDYGAQVIDSDTAAFQLNSMDLGSLAFSTNNVKAHVDFEERVGEFTSNGEETFVEFPMNEYICYMDVFKWYMDQNDIELQSSKQAAATDLLIETGGVDLPGSNFYSIHKEQDSLNFIAPKARYDLDTYIIHCNEVPYIRVADANISPDSGYVEVHRKAKMQTLTEAVILANNITKYHRVYNASVNIFSKNAYSGAGDYDYEDENKMKQTIHFTGINVDTTLQSIGVGKVLPDDNFTLSPNFEYQGEVRMFANQKFLTFDGSTRISHDCPGLAKNWMNFVAEIDPNQIFIPVSGELVDENGKPIGAGVVLNQDSISLYSTFLSNKKKKEHTDVITADGFLFFDKKAREYQISNKDKLKEKSLPGNFVGLNIESCLVSGDGTMDFGVDVGQIDFVPIGKVTNDIAANEVNIRSAVVVDFLFNDDASKRMAEQINAYPDLEGLDFNKSPYEQTLRESIGLEAADKLIAELTLNGKIRKFPDELIHTMFLADVKFKWDQETDSYISQGKIGIGNIGKHQVFKYVDGHIQMRKKRGGDEMHVYLELDRNNYFYFTYSRGLMQVWSSDTEFNTIVKETKDDKRKSKGEKGDTPYSFNIGSRARLTKFLAQFD